MRCSGCGLDRKLLGAEKLCSGCFDAKYLHGPGIHRPPAMTGSADSLPPSVGDPASDQTEQERWKLDTSDRWRMKGEVVGFWLAGKAERTLYVMERMLRWVK